MSTIAYIKLCYENGIIFNPKKFHFGHDDIEFAGFELTTDGFSPTKERLQSIQNFTVPGNLTDVRAWFGLIEQVSFAFSKSQTMAPFRELLKKKEFYWDETITQLFFQARENIVEAVYDGVKSFDIKKETALTTDWSKEGIGYFLQKKHCKCKGGSPHCSPGHWKLITAGSRFTKDAERRYSPVEGEALAITYGLLSTKVYYLGNPRLWVGMDHRPLLSIMGPKPMNEIENPRLLSFKQKCVQFRYKIFHVPEKDNIGPDFNSRYPGGHGKKVVDDDLDDEPTISCTSLKNRKVMNQTVMAMCNLSMNSVDTGTEDIEDDAQAMAITAISSFESLKWEDLREQCTLDEKT